MYGTACDLVLGVGAGELTTAIVTLTTLTVPLVTGRVGYELETT